MTTAFFSHPACLGHDSGADHPESPQRLSAIADRFIASGLMDVVRVVDAPEATEEQILRVHSPQHLEIIRATADAPAGSRLDPDTVVGPGSLAAATRAAGAVVSAVDQVMSGDIDSAFCNVRPPGHHAESNRAMGFCLLNNIAIGAAHALEAHGLDRVAVLDFDVHQGNGTEEIFRDEPRVLFCSTFQYPFYPHTPIVDDAPHQVNVPLQAGATGAEFRAAVTDHWLPALEAFKPQLIFVSAGFDAHAADDMSQVNLVDADYRWVSENIATIAGKYAANRVISALEGGYELHSLARCAEAHVRVLMGLD